MGVHRFKFVRCGVKSPCVYHADQPGFCSVFHPPPASIRVLQCPHATLVSNPESKMAAHHFNEVAHPAQTAIKYFDFSIDGPIERAQPCRSPSCLCHLYNLSGQSEEFWRMSLTDTSGHGQSQPAETAARMTWLCQTGNKLYSYDFPLSLLK